jgi:hypothetical protein
MAQRGKRAPEDASPSAECLLSYREADGSIASVGPLSRERAEALVQVYGRMYPDQAYWVEPLRKEVQDLHTGRVRRPRRLPVVAPSDRDH